MLRLLVLLFNTTNICTIFSHIAHVYICFYLGFLRNKPLGPIIISGPASCGSSQLVHRTIDKVNSSGLHLLDCDKYASADTHKGGILNAFVRSSGYNMMPKILGDLKIGRDSGGSVNEGELQLCMKYYNEASGEYEKIEKELICSQQDMFKS